MTRGTTLVILAVLIAAHIALAATFASITPFRTPGFLFGSRDPATGGPQHVADIGAPDERQHVNYVLGLVHGGGLPVFNPKDPNLNETLESHQPPLFYVLAAGWGSILGAYMPPEPPATEGKEMAQDDGVKLRSLNVVIGALTVGGVFMLAFWAYRKPEVALAATAFAALLPMHAALNGAVSNDPLLICLCTWVLALVAKSIWDGWTIGTALAVGILTGLAILTKTSGVALLPVLLVAVMMKQDRRPTGRQLVAAVVPTLVMVLPWWVRNQKLYGDPLAMGAFSQAFVGTAQASTFIQAFGTAGYWISMVGLWTVCAFIGAFGYMDIWLTNTGMRGGAQSIYLVAWLVILAAIAGWVMAVRRDNTDGKRMHLLNGLFFLVVLLLFLKFNMQYFQAQARYLLPAIGPIACGIGLGLVTLARDRWKVAISVVVIVFGFISAFALTKLPGEFAKRQGTVTATLGSDTSGPADAVQVK